MVVTLINETKVFYKSAVKVLEENTKLDNDDIKEIVYALMYKAIKEEHEKK